VYLMITIKFQVTFSELNKKVVGKLGLMIHI
jgi:hypothetical protein